MPSAQDLYKASLQLHLRQPNLTPASSTPQPPPWRRNSRTTDSGPSRAAASTPPPAPQQPPPPPEPEPEPAPQPPPPPPPPLVKGPPPPPPPPMEPPPPPPAPFPKKELPPSVLMRLDSLRKTPRKRPDWASMMKEIETGKQLRRVQTNDRSKPILPKVKAKGKVLNGQKLPTWSDDQADDGEMTTVFVYDSEKPTPNLFNQLLNEIQRGVRLKKTKCNDRSRPVLQGLGTFRRQMSTVDDQQEPTTPLMDPDEDYDDIDKVRDDLQSTKQLLEIEMKNRTKYQDENHKLLAEIRRLKEELLRRPTVPAAVPLAVALPPVSLNHVTKKSASKAAIRAKKSENDSDEESDEDFGELDAVEEEMNQLRGQAELARKTALEYEHKYKETSQKLATTQAEMEDMEQKVVVLKKKLRRAMQDSGKEDEDIPDVCNSGCQTEPMEWPTDNRPTRSFSRREMRRQMSRQDSRGSNLEGSVSAAGESQKDEESEEEEESDEENEEEGTDDAELKSQKREISLLLSRLRSLKDKERNIRNERVALHQQMKKLRRDLKDESKRLAKLQKEVDGMAKLMNEAAQDEDAEIVVEEVEVTDSEEEDEENEKKEEEEEEDEDEEEEESDEEDEEEESEEDTESDEMETRLEKLNERVHNHEDTLGTLRKRNYLLKSTVEKMQDDLRQERSKYAALELELNTCLAELG